MFRDSFFAAAPIELDREVRHTAAGPVWVDAASRPGEGSLRRGRAERAWDFPLAAGPDAARRPGRPSCLHRGRYPAAWNLALPLIDRWLMRPCGSTRWAGRTWRPFETRTRRSEGSSSGYASPSAARPESSAADFRARAPRADGVCPAGAVAGSLLDRGPDLCAVLMSRRRTGRVRKSLTTCRAWCQRKTASSAINGRDAGDRQRSNLMALIGSIAINMVAQTKECDAGLYKASAGLRVRPARQEDRRSECFQDLRPGGVHCGQGPGINGGGPAKSVATISRLSRRSRRWRRPSRRLAVRSVRWGA